MGNVVPFERDSAYLARKAGDNRRAGRWLDALFLQRRAIAQGAGQDGEIELAHMLYEMGCHALSNRMLARVLAESSPPDECFYALSCNYLALGERELAYRAILKYLSCNPDAASREEVGELLKELVADKFGLNAPGKSRRIRHASRLERAGARCAAHGQYAQAVDLYAQAIRARRGKGTGSARTNMALALVPLGKVKSAAREITRALRALPVSNFTLSAAARVYARAGCMGLARENAARLAARKPENEALAGLIAAWRAVGEDEKVYELARQMMKLHPYDLALLSDLAVSCAHMGRTREAKGLWGRALMIDPEDVPAKWALNHLDALGRDLPYDTALPRSVTRGWKDMIERAALMSDEALKAFWSEELCAACRWALCGEDREAMLLARSALNKIDDPKGRALLQSSQAEIAALSQADQVVLPLRLRRAMKDAVWQLQSDGNENWQEMADRVMRLALAFHMRGLFRVTRDVPTITAALYGLAVGGEYGALLGAVNFHTKYRRVRRLMRHLEGEKGENHEPD